jgi:hypothetical protein
MILFLGGLLGIDEGNGKGLLLRVLLGRNGGWGGGDEKRGQGVE